MCGAFERKEIFLNIDKIKIYLWYYHSKWSSKPLKFRNQDLHDLFLEKLFWHEGHHVFAAFISVNNVIVLHIT